MAKVAEVRAALLWAFNEAKKTALDHHGAFGGVPYQACCRACGGDSPTAEHNKILHKRNCKFASTARLLGMNPIFAAPKYREGISRSGCVLDGVLILSLEQAREVLRKFKLSESPTDGGGMNLCYLDGYFINSIYSSVRWKREGYPDLYKTASKIVALATRKRKRKAA